jgi:hypothetical protein
VLYVLIGFILLVVIWALISAYSGKADTRTEAYAAPTMPEPEPKFNEPEMPRAHDWQDGAKTSVSKNFGKGGAPTGVSKDAGGLATSKDGYDDDEWLRNARPFEPRATKLDLDKDTD